MRVAATPPYIHSHQSLPYRLIHPQIYPTSPEKSIFPKSADVVANGKASHREVTTPIHCGQGSDQEQSLVNSSKFPKLESELNAFNNSETSGSSTDLSLKSKSQTASTSVGASIDGKSLSGNSSSLDSGSGKNTDDGSGSDDSGAVPKESYKHKPSAIPEHEMKESEESKSPTPVEPSHPPHLRYLPVLKLSTANMKKHDLELAQLGPLKRNETKFTNIGAAAAAAELSSNTESSESKRRKRSRNKRKRFKLPEITSGLDRKFPLPNPKQIELYTRGEDSVHLDPRPYCVKDSSTPASTEGSSTESSSR